MNQYDVTITYTVKDHSQNAPIDPDSGQPIYEQGGLKFRTRVLAANPGTATSKASALFTMLGNVKDPEGRLFITINRTDVQTVTYSEN